MAPAETEVNPYELLGLEIEAQDADIRTAYRSRSLKVHPDRNRNDPDAARKFHELNQAYELLLDPLRRLAWDAKLRLAAARKQRTAGFDAKRKGLLDELEEREREFKKQKTARDQETKQRWHETERIKEENKKLMEEMMKRRTENRQPSPVTAEEADPNAPPELGSRDTIVKLKYSLKTSPDLTTAEAISELLKTFGETDTSSIAISLKSPKKKGADGPATNGTAVVQFLKIGDAHAAVCASASKTRGLQEIKITWVDGQEPPILGWLRAQGKLEVPVTKVASTEKLQTLPQHQTSTGAQFSSFPSFTTSEPVAPAPTPALPKDSIDYESLTLMRLRQAERERLKREIREAEAAET